MRRFFLALGMVISIAAMAPAGAEAQVAQAAPADTAAILVDLARQLQAEGRRELAAALFTLVSDRYPGTLAASEALSHLAILRAAMPERSGRTQLLVGSTLYGLWLGAAVPAAFGADDVTTYGLGLLVGGPTGFLLARQIASDRPLGEGQARAITFGSLWGTWQGLGWRYVLGIGETRYCVDSGGGCPSDDYYFQETSSRAIFGSAIVGGLAGIGTGALLASRGPIDAERMTVANFGALWGTWYGVAAGLAADAEGKNLMAATLIGGDLGLLLSALMAPRWELSRSRARLISVAGVAGGVAGLGLDLLIQPDDPRVAILIPALTSIAGLAAGAAWTRAHDEARGTEGRGGARDADAPEVGGALLNLRGGQVGWGVPLPEPALVDRDRAGTDQVLGARLMILRATF
jgi:hypothetical protein